MKAHTEGCLICGKPLIYYESAKLLHCHICGGEHTADATCEQGHYVCDSCHAQKGLAVISQHTAVARSKNPIDIAGEIMESPYINMHGPEHHPLVAMALLTAYKNSGGDIDLEKALQNAMQRGKNVPGGICGMWGSCGAGIATGIFVSIATGATPLSESQWSLANEMTSRSLAAISANGGPRCCKRDSFLAITQAAAFSKEKLGVVMEMPDSIGCGFSHRNNACREEKCLYYVDGN